PQANRRVPTLADYRQRRAGRALVRKFQQEQDVLKTELGRRRPPRPFWSGRQSARCFRKVAEIPGDASQSEVLHHDVVWKSPLDRGFGSLPVPYQRIVVQHCADRTGPKRVEIMRSVKDGVSLGKFSRSV